MVESLAKMTVDGPTLVMRLWKRKMMILQAVALNSNRNGKLSTFGALQSPATNLLPHSSLFAAAIPSFISRSIRDGS